MVHNGINLSSLLVAKFREGFQISFVQDQNCSVFHVLVAAEIIDNVVQCSVVDRCFFKIGCRVDNLIFCLCRVVENSFELSGSSVTDQDLAAHVSTDRLCYGSFHYAVIVRVRKFNHFFRFLGVCGDLLFLDRYVAENGFCCVVVAAFYGSACSVAVGLNITPLVCLATV